MKRFGIGAASGMKEIISYQVARWAFGKFFVPFGIPKMIVVDSGRFFLECSRKLFRIPY